AYTSTIATVQDCLPTDPPSACETPDSPARSAGFQPGDTVVSWGGAPVSAWSDVTELIREGGTAPVDVVVRRGGEEFTLTVVPAELERAVLVDQVNTVVEGDSPVTEVVPYVGIGPRMELETQPLSAVPPVFWNATVQTLGLIPRLPLLLWDVAESLITGEEREGGVLGPVGVGRAAGEIAATSSAVYGLEARVFDMLGLVASLNIALFAFNLIPLPPLDGGHVAGAVVEGVRRSAARLVGRVDPGPFDMARALPLTYAVVILLIGMGVLLAIADIVRPVTF
ncbi:MAG: site-2 protease family protein, partial [Actinomycetota bacterium]